MSSINDEGFLSKDINDWIKKYHSDYKDIFKLAFDLNRFAQKLMFMIDVHTDSQELLLSLFYLRALSTYQSIIILAERGLISESRVLCRNLIEIMFALVACAKHKDISEMYILNNVKDSLKSLNKFKSSKKLMDLLSSKINFSGREKELKEQIDEKNIKQLSTEELSKKAELHDHYLTVYNNLSQTAHVKIRDLEQHLDLPSTKFKWGPKVEGIDFVLLTTISELIIIIKTVIDFFSNQEMFEANEFEKKCAYLMKKLKMTNL